MSQLTTGLRIIANTVSKVAQKDWTNFSRFPKPTASNTLMVSAEAKQAGFVFLKIRSFVRDYA